MSQAKRMIETGRETARRSRALATILAALPLLLQLLFAAAPFALATNARADVALAVSDCATPDHRQAPAGEGAHSHCCLLCEWGLRDGVAIIGSFIVTALGADAHATPIRATADRLWPAPIGWTTSWSSRAPPAFS
ncbi:hypothetical protein [Methylosinus sporium]|uniref:hypothetical protein n=1 Tax=Methylosinus sporium TaxID=428 RepID=UPI00383A5C57